MREAIRRNPSSLGWYTNGKVVARDVAQGLAFLHSHRMVSHTAFIKAPDQFGRQD